MSLARSIRDVSTGDAQFTVMDSTTNDDEDDDEP